MPDIAYPRMPMPSRVRGADEPPEMPQCEPGHPMVLHTITFQKNTVTGLYRAKCSCGWLYVACTLCEVQESAAAHDMWVPA